MKTLTEIRRLLNENRKTLMQRFGVKRIAIFGSYARNEHTLLSDVDILVELKSPLGWEIVDLHDYLEQLLEVRVDLSTLGALQRKPYLWESVRKDVVDV